MQNVGVLGATGSVGQRFIQLLSDHSSFNLHKLGASSRSAGKKYSSAADWKQGALMPSCAADLVVVECKPDLFRDCKLVFSGLDSDVAGDIEKQFVDAGINVVSNAKNYRRAEHVPLVVPTVNSQHLDIFQSKRNSAIHVCISNCSTAGIVVPLKALQDKFGPIDKVVTTTLQAISGAGFAPGVPSIDILDNIIPYISGEEDKLEWEPRKILGTISGDRLVPLPNDQMQVSATCTRVPVIDGHTACVSVKFRNQPAPSPDEIKTAMREFTCEAQNLSCPSAPQQVIEILDQPNRPQPRLDRDRGRGFAVSVGRVRPDPVLDIKFVALSHNTILGAAGSGVLIGELLLSKGLLN